MSGHETRFGHLTVNGKINIFLLITEKVSVLMVVTVYLYIYHHIYVKFSTIIVEPWFSVNSRIQKRFGKVRPNS